MKILFVSSCSPIVADHVAARHLFGDGLGIPFEHVVETYAYTEQLPGMKHFGLWPLSEAARACFGSPTWPEGVRVPQASIEFEVDDVAAAADELVGKGHVLLHAARTEPWGQTVARLLSPDGLVVGVSHAPWLRAQ